MISHTEMQALRQAALQKRAAELPVPIWDPRRAGDRIEGRITAFKNEPRGSSGMQAVVATHRGVMAIWLIGSIRELQAILNARSLLKDLKEARNA